MKALPDHHSEEIAYNIIYVVKLYIYIYTKYTDVISLLKEEEIKRFMAFLW